MNEKLKKAYELIKKETGYKKVLSCSQLSNDEFLFELDRQEDDDVVEIFNDDGGLYKVNVMTQKVEPVFIMDYIASNEPLPRGKQIDPEIFEIDNTFNL